MNRINLINRFRLVGAFALILLASCELGAPTKGGGTEGEGVVGSLVDPTGAPLDGVWVKAWPLETALAKSAAVAAVDSVQTNDEGQFHFPGLSAGVYNFTATTTVSGTTYALFLKSVIIAPGTNSIHGDTLRVSGTLTFQVQAGGQGVEGAVCYLDGSPWAAVSDANGTCTLTGLPPGTLQFSVSHPAFASVLTQAASVVSGTISSGGVVVGNNTATVSRYVKASWPDSVAPIAGEDKFAVGIARLVFKRNNVVVKDTVRLTYFTDIPRTFATLYHNLNIIGGDTLKVTAYGQLKGMIEIAYPGPHPEDSARILFTGKHVVLLTDLPQDTLTVPLTFTGPTGIPDAPALQPTFTTVMPLSDTLRWGSVALAESYHVQMSTDSMFVNLVQNDSGLATTTRAYGPLTPGYYFWRARAKNGMGTSPWSRWQSLVTVGAGNGSGGNDSTPPAKPGVPSLISPTLEATGISVYATLNWTRGTSESAGVTLAYRVLVGTDTAFSNPIMNDQISVETGATGYSRMTPRLSSGTRYFWRVVAVGPGGNSPSPLYSFVTESPAGPLMPIGITPTAPTHNAVNVPVHTTLTWSPLLQGAVYDLTVSRDSTFSTIVRRDSSLLVTQRSLDSLLPGSRYFWRVTTRIPQGVGIMGEYQYFAFTTAGTPPTIPTPPPVSPETTFTDTGVVIRWVTASDDSGKSSSLSDSGHGGAPVPYTPWSSTTIPDTLGLDTVSHISWQSSTIPDTSWMDTVAHSTGDSTFVADSSGRDALPPAPWESPAHQDSTFGDTVSAAGSLKASTRIASHATLLGAETFRMALRFERSRPVRPDQRDARRRETSDEPEQSNPLV